MADKRLTQHQRDFIDMLRATCGKHIARWAQDHAEAGRDPRDITTALEAAAKKARGWCIGRYGR